MKNLKVITESLVKVNSLENQADDLFDMSIEMLFQQVAQLATTLRPFFRSRMYGRLTSA